jgi:hypothetical protein
MPQLAPCLLTSPSARPGRRFTCLGRTGKWPAAPAMCPSKCVSWFVQGDEEWLFLYVQQSPEVRLASPACNQQMSTLRLSHTTKTAVSARCPFSAFRPDSQCVCTEVSLSPLWGTRYHLCSPPPSRCWQNITLTVLHNTYMLVWFRQLEGVTYGLPPSVSTYNYLANPTPGAANSAARTGDAPVITRCGGCFPLAAGGQQLACQQVDPFVWRSSW